MNADGAVGLLLGPILVCALAGTCSAIAVLVAFALLAGFDPGLGVAVAIHQQTPSPLVDVANVRVCSILEVFCIVTPAAKTPWESHICESLLILRPCMPLDHEMPLVARHLQLLWGLPFSPLS